MKITGMNLGECSWKLIMCLSICFFFSSCGEDKQTGSYKTTSTGEKTEGFEYLSWEKSNITFNNVFDHKTAKLSVDYINVFNGGGVAIGDINNDGLADIFFTGNQADNKLYLNKGGLEFKDISKSAKIEAVNSWCTGVTMADVNQDGYLDIYVSRSYEDDLVRKRSNLLYINNGDLTFSELGNQYGVDDAGYTIQSVFFDMDNDGDLDLYVANHPRTRASTNSIEFYKKWQNPTRKESDRLYRNNGNNKFKDVTEEAGVLNFGWKLGLSVADFNEDGFTDIYVTNDHSEPDCYYENNGDGSFTNKINERFKHLSLSSMGTDFADFNNDGFLDLLTLDMLSEDNFREKSQMASMNIKAYWDMVGYGYHHQMMRNMLQINTGFGSFRDVGQMAGIHKTDWSWAALGADFNNDLNADIFITNGYLLDIMDKDISLVNKRIQGGLEDANKKYRENQNKLSSTPLKNYFYLNNGELSFENKSEEYNLDFLGYSSGAAYGDLDNDGDLDLVINNMNDTASIHINKSMDGPNHNRYLRVKLVNGDNTAYGTKVKLYVDDHILCQELSTTRGYQSSVEPILHFGLEDYTRIAKMEVIWPGNIIESFKDIETDQLLEIVRSKGTQVSKEQKEYLLSDITNASGLDFKHRENSFFDYGKQILLPHKMSQFGPAISKGDFNNDQFEDIFIGGAANQVGQLYTQTSAGKFKKHNSSFLNPHRSQEDIASILEDLDGDGDLDLYVVSGGNEFEPGSKQYTDRVYHNDGNGSFSYNADALPSTTNISGSCVKAFDYDGDGDKDLFVGARHTPWNYPLSSGSLILQNDAGIFKDVTNDIASDLADIGMVTDAEWNDLNGDGKVDLLIVGEWMPITFLINDGSQFTDETSSFGFSNSKGWWNAIESTDLNGDGTQDYILGNLGDNYKYRVNDQNEFHIYAKDFDNNNSTDIVLAYLNNEKLYPVRGRQCSSEQCPMVKEKFATYGEFGNAGVDAVYDLEGALHHEINSFKSSVLMSNGSDFDLIELPNSAQASPVNGICFMDVDKDGTKEIILGGNLYVSEVETGRADAGIGVTLKFSDGKFIDMPASDTGLLIDKDVKQLLTISGNGRQFLLVANNDDHIQMIEVI